MRRIDAFTSQHVTNYGRYCITLNDAYSAWMSAASGSRSHARERARQVLGVQDYCWNGSTCRNWIWERPVEVTLDDGRTITRHWRLYASIRGFVLEIEDGGQPWGETMKQVAPQVWDAFLKEWRAEDKGWDQAAWDEMMDIRRQA
jgi:hypothetical protein